jgi:hypothetical protein
MKIVDSWPAAAAAASSKQQQQQQHQAVGSIDGCQPQQLRSAPPYSSNTHMHLAIVAICIPVPAITKRSSTAVEQIALQI